MPHASKASFSSGPAARGTLLRFLFAYAWKYRFGCVKVLTLQICVLVLGLSGLGLMGLGVDYIRFEAGQRGIINTHVLTSEKNTALPATASADAAPSVKPATTPKPPKWPLGIQPPPDARPMRVLLIIAGVILGLALARGGLQYAYTIQLNHLVQGQIVVDLRAHVYEKMQSLSFRFFDTNASASIINRVTGDVQNVRMFVDGVIMPCIVLVLSLTIYLVYMLRIHVGLTLACLCTTPLLAYTTFRFSRRLQPRYRRVREKVDNLVLALSEHLHGIGVVKCFGLQEKEKQRFADANRAVLDEQLGIFRTVSWFNPLIGLYGRINMAILLAYGGWLVIAYERAPDALTAGAVGLSIGQLLIFSGLLGQFAEQVGNVANIANSAQQSLIAAQRVYEVLTAPVEISSKPDANRLTRPRGSVIFENVTFGYSFTDPVLHNISFAARPGECIAVLGATGAGKSTLMSLIPRFYDPQSGRVLVDGMDVRDMDVNDLRMAIGIVFQESFLFSTSVANNIAFGRPDATRAQVETAARIASADKFIRAMPKGYDTILHEGGADLSGGQRQRIAIARAILREPAILLLDDPTAAIDAHTEDEILQAMESAMKGRTTFVVAHRLSTLSRADRVIVLDHGRIVEMGTHAELMQKDGFYQEIVEMQIADPKDAALAKGGPA
jgi:ATP-binding cassette subfamily B protein